MEQCCTLIPITLTVVSIICLFTVQLKDNRHILTIAQVIGVISAVLMLFLSSQAIPQYIKIRFYVTSKHSNVHLFGLLSILCFMLHPLIGIFGWTDWIGITITKSSCEGVYFSALICYTFGKIFMYWVFAFRVKHFLLRFPSLQILPLIFWLYIGFSCLVTLALNISWMYDVRSGVKPHPDDNTSSNSFHHCYPMDAVTVSDNNISIAIFVFDVFFQLGALLVYLCKWHQIHNSQHEQPDTLPDQQSFQQPMTDSNDITEKVVKQLYCWVITMCTVAMVSTAIFTAGICFIQREIGFFSSADSLVNAWCIFLLKFEFFDWSCKNNVEYTTI
eukprot:UN01694